MSYYSKTNTYSMYSVNGRLTQRNINNNGLMFSKGNAKCIIEISVKDWAHLSTFKIFIFEKFYCLGSLFG